MAVQNPENEFEKFYESVLNVVGSLIILDPPLSSPEGRLLENLAVAIEEYEKVKYPDIDPPPPDLPTSNQ